MTELLFPDIASDLFDANDICSFCGSKLAAVDRVGDKLATACVNRNCQFRYCSCASDLKKGLETADCPVHWRCDCRKGYLCGRHRLRPHFVQRRYKTKGKLWADATGFSTIHDQANLWIQACKQQEKKALAHCGSCFSVLTKAKSKAAGLPDTVCPKGCKCRCASGKECHVHLTCGCLNGFELCQFHKATRPAVIVALYHALPSTSQIRLKLIERMSRAGVALADHRQKGRRTKELDIRELVRQARLTIHKPENSLSPAGPAKSQASEPSTAPPIEPENSKRVHEARPPELKRVLSVRQTVAKFDLASDLSAKLADYKDWLAKQGLSHHSARNYLSRIKGFIAILQKLSLEHPPLSAATKDFAVRDLQKHLKKDAKVKPATLNSYLAAIDNFYGFLGLGKTDVVREDLPQEAPQALTQKDQKKFLRAIELTRRKKDRAIATLLFYSGIRASECASLELDDVFVVGRKTRAIIRYGKGGRYREVPLNSLVCETMQAWLTERKEKFASKSVASAVFLNPQGKPMLPNAIYEVVRKIGLDAGLELSPHTLRHTCLTTLVRKQNDVILVADIAGHKSLNTTRRYTLPTVADKAKALEELLE